MMEPKYSICSVSYNMSDTIEESLRSILDQIDDRFEVFLFDESNDGSIEILRQLKKEYDNFRFKHIEPDPEIHLGKARNISVRDARGNYVLLQLDMDDKYKGGVIKDFVKIFHSLEEKMSSEFYLKGNHINMVKKDFFLDELGGYWNIGRGEDKELWRRLIEMDRMIILDHNKACKKIGYYRRPLDKMRAFYETVRNEFRCGMSLSGYIKWCLTRIKYIMLIPIVLWAYALVNLKGTHVCEPPENLNDRMNLKRIFQRKKRNLKEIKKELNIQIKKRSSQEKEEGFSFKG